MNKQRHPADGRIGHRVHNPGIVTNDSIGVGGEDFRDNLKPWHGVVGYGCDGFDLIRYRAAGCAKCLKDAVHANSYEVLAVGVGIGSLLGYLAALRWVCDRF